MNAAALLRSKIQASLAPHLRTELEFRPYVPPDVVASGISELDGLLGGGLTRGGLTEVCGPTSSGRTSLVYSVLAQMTQRQEVCAVVDVSDALDPESLAGAGADPTRILWVRCGGTKAEQAALQESPVINSKNTYVPVKKHSGGSTARHPRDSARGLDTAMGFLLDKNKETVVPKNNLRTPLPPKPGVAANPFAASCAGEQVSLDRHSPRRGEYFLSQHSGSSWEEDSHERTCESLKPQSTVSSRCAEKPWPRLEQAVKAVDLLLHGGGFGAVVLDLGNMPWTDARRIPLTTWFRFRRAVENTSTVLIVLAEASCAKTCASLVLSCQRNGEEWAHAGTSVDSRNRATLAGFAVQVEVLRSRVPTSASPRDGNLAASQSRSVDLQSGKPVRSVRSGTEFLDLSRSAHWRTRTLWTG
jgi:recombination protein RecA